MSVQLNLYRTYNIQTSISSSTDTLPTYAHMHIHMHINDIYIRMYMCVHVHTYYKVYVHTYLQSTYAYLQRLMQN